MSSEYLDNFSQSFQTHILSSEASSAMDFMNLMDSCFKLCTAQKENQVIQVILRAFQELKKKIDRRVDIDQGKYRYIMNHPIIPIKELNERIAWMAFGHTEEMEYLLFCAKAQAAQRICAYLHRFYIPHKRHRNKTFTFDGVEHPFESVYNMVLRIVWGEPPIGRA